MNTRSFAPLVPPVRTSTAIIVVSMLILSALVVLSLANQVVRNDAPATSTSVNHERFAAFKQVQAMRVADAAMVYPAVDVAVPLFAAVKQAQAMQAADAATVAWPTPCDQACFAALKERQALQAADAAMLVWLPTPCDQACFADVKQAQAMQAADAVTAVR